MNKGKLFWKHNRGLLSCLIALAVILILTLIFSSALWPFLVGLVVVNIFVPVVDWIQNHLPLKKRFSGAKRIFSIILSSAIILGAGGFFAAYIIRAVIGALTDILFQAPILIEQAFNALQSWLEEFRLLMPEDYAGDLFLNIEEITVSLMQAAQDALLDALLRLPSTMGIIFGIFILPFILFYLLRDWHSLWKRLQEKMPVDVRGHASNILYIIKYVIGGYIRAQGVLGIGVGIIVYIGLVILGVPFAPALAGVAFIGEFIPIVGPWASGAFAVIIALATVPEAAIWVAVLYIAANGIENSLLRPKIEGSFLKLHPALVLFLIVVGSYVAGFWGLVLIVPLSATFIRLVRYVRMSTVVNGEEPSHENQKTSPT